MANERKLKTSKNKNIEQKVVAASTLTPSSMARKNNVSRMPESPSSPDGSHSSSVKDNEEEEIEDEIEEEEAEEEEKEDVDDEVEEDEEKNESPSLLWPKNDDLELFKRIRKACPKDDAMKYDSRINHLNWESIQFQDYSAEQCKSRWLHIQTHLRHYRILAEVLEDAAFWVDRPWYNFNKGGKNNQKHPDQPKKPLTSYMLFYMEQKDSVLENQPGLGMTELSKVIAKMYHELSERKKMKYSEMAEKQKEVYQEKMKKFMDANPDYVVPKSKQAAKAVPPKPPTPFKLFSDEKMVKYISEGMTPIEARERCRDSYKELKDKQKLKWIYKSLEQEHEYNEELEQFKANHPDVDVAAKKLSLLTKDELQIKHKSEGKPEKPPNSGYSLFSKKLLSSNSLKQFETKERMSEISRLWKELNDEEKSSYNIRATQMNHSYKMKYASYLETLTPEQRNAELVSSVGKNMKRIAGKIPDEQPVGKKQKISSVVAAGSSSDSDEDVASDEEDFEIPLKTAIQKPNSSLQMFCNSNMDKYSSKHPKLSKQELTRLMAKEFAKLSEDKKKIYGNMAQKSKNEMSATSKKSSSTTSKVKTLKTENTSKKVAVKSGTSVSPLKSPTRDSSSKKNTAAVNTDSKSPVKSPSKFKPSLNANVKSTDKIPSKTIKSPIWASSQSLFKTENMIEPPKPPESAAAYYVMKHHSKTANLSAADIDILWKKVSEKQKKKCIEEHKKRQKDYVVDFENFVRLLKSDELKAFRVFMKNRDQDHGQDGAQNTSSDESASINSNEDGTSGACSDDDEPQISSDED